MLVLGMGVADLSIALFTIDKVIDHPRLQWSWSKQGYQCNNIFKAVGPKFADQLFHTPRLKLEDSGGFTALHQFIGGLIIERNLINFQKIFTGGTAIGINHPHRPVDNRQGAQSKEIEFNQTGIFDIILIKLGDNPCSGIITVDR